LIKQKHDGSLLKRNTYKFGKAVGNSGKNFKNRWRKI